MDTQRSETVLFVGGPHHGQRMQYLGARILVADNEPLGERDVAQPVFRNSLAAEGPQAVTEYTVRDLYVSGKLVRVASPAEMAEDDVLNWLADLMERSDLG